MNTNETLVLEKQEETEQKSKRLTIIDAAQALYIEISDELQKLTNEVYHGRLKQFDEKVLVHNSENHTFFRVGLLNHRNIYVGVNNRTLETHKYYEDFEIVGVNSKGLEDCKVEEEANFACKMSAANKFLMYLKANKTKECTYKSIINKRDKTGNINGDEYHLFDVGNIGNYVIYIGFNERTLLCEKIIGIFEFVQ